MQGVIWDIDSFDQWGVELGKVLARGVLGKLHNPVVEGEDSSTTWLIEKWQSLQA